MSQKSLQVALQNIGLSEKETIVYLTSLSTGLSTISNITKKCDINRSTVYSIFYDLIEKGIAYKVKDAGITKFTVLTPDALFEYLEREKRERIHAINDQKEIIEDILPELKSLENTLNTKPKVRFFEGEKGMREAYELTLLSTGQLRAYANVEEVHKGLPNFFPDYYLRRKDKGILMHAIFTDNPISRERSTHDAEEFRVTRFIPRHKYTFSPEMNIWDDNILINSWKEKMAILITSKEIADLQRNTFDLLWGFL